MTEQEPDPEPREIECDDCGKETEIRAADDLCGDCRFDRAMAQIEPPEGGWPRGSDMDRI